MEPIKRSKSLKRLSNAKLERVKIKVAKINKVNEDDLNERITQKQTSRQDTAELSRSLEFGHKFKASYKKHGYQGVKDIFWNSNSK